MLLGIGGDVFSGEIPNSGPWGQRVKAHAVLLDADIVPPGAVSFYLFTSHVDSVLLFLFYNKEI